MPQPLKIFISSPGDVSEERRRAALVISRLKREFARFFELSAVLWEYEPMLSSGHFQDIIDPPSTADIVVLILWSRLGTPLPERTALREYRGLDGHTPVTGTEWEYEQALEAREKKGVPDLLVYRKLSDGLAKFNRAEQLDQIRQQWESLQGFWQRYFEEPDGRFKAAFNRFANLEEFETQFELHLRELLRRRLPPQPLRIAAPRPGTEIEWWSGSPYGGLKSFDMDMAPVFFGRERAEREITEALVRHAGEGAAFMLVLGASGSGKSSLVRAGLLPDLMAPGVVEGVSFWRNVVVHAAELAIDPFAGLAAALRRPKALPELAAIGYQETDLIAQFGSDPALATVPLRLALERAGAENPDIRPGDTRRGRLVLVLDQLEVLFTTPEFGDEARLALDGVLARLAQSGLVWIIATLRSDFFHRMVDMPALNALAAGHGQYLLAPPNATEIEQIITRPAEVAGLTFEIAEQTGISLAADIREAAARDPASLPLLSFVLDELYRRDVLDGGGNVLTNQSYGALGKLEGAIARHAEALVEKLSPELASALPALLLSLVDVDELKATVTARTVPRASLANPMQKELADLLVTARLAVADDTGSGQTLRLAHEALLTQWPRLAQLIEEHRDFLIVRRRLQGDAATWNRNGRHSDFLLPAGRRLAGAEEALAQRRGELEPDVIDYIEASITAERERIAAAQRAKEEALLRELKRSRRIAAIVSVLLVAALGAGGLALWARSVATEAQEQAEHHYRLALDQAAGSVQVLVEKYREGAISTELLQTLIKRAQATVGGLPAEKDDVTAARAQLLGVLSIAYVTLGDASTGQQFAEQEIALFDRLIAKNRNNVQWRRYWAFSRARLGDALFWKGDSTSALEKTRAAENGAAELAAAHPDDDILQYDLTAIYLQLGDMLRSLGQLDGALQADWAWVKHAEAQVARNRTSVKWLGSLASANLALGDTLIQQGKPAEAAIHYQTSIALSSQLVASHPQDERHLHTLTVSHERAGDAMLAQGNTAGAMPQYQTAVRLATQLSNANPSHFQRRELLEATHQRVGELYLKEKRYDDALREFNIYLSLAKETLAKIPTNGSALYDVANAREKVGDALREKGNLDGALDEYQESLKIATELNSRGWWNGGWKKILATSYHRIGITLQAKGDLRGALAQFQKCVAIPVNKYTWTPRSRWPQDVTEECRQHVIKLGGTMPPQ